MLGDGALVAEVTASVHMRIEDRRAAIRVECAAWPAQIAALREEAQGALALADGADEPARRLVQQRLNKLAEQIDRREAQLGAAERELARLDNLQIEASWIDGCLREFDRIWDILSPPNRARLVRAVIDRVEVDEPTGKVTLTLADLSAQVSATADPAPAHAAAHIGVS